MNIQYMVNKLVEKENLTQKESENLLIESIRGNSSPLQISAILTAFRMKGETENEIIGFIHAMRKSMLKIVAENAIDVCGTGGDGKQTFNISTAVSFVVAGCGVPVVKHGNRAASSTCGSADVLEGLGVKIDVTPEQAEKVLEKIGMVFVFAPVYHPSLKNLGAVRKELGFRTVFNFLGPFVNPASVKRQVIGVPNLEIARTLAAVGKRLHYQHLILLTSEDGMDEVSISGKTYVFDMQQTIVKKYIISPEDFGIKKASQKELIGGSVKDNAKIIQSILNGKKGSQRDIIVLNSAVALYVGGKVKSIDDGIIMAAQSIDSGTAKNILEKLIQETQKYA